MNNSDDADRLPVYTQYRDIPQEHVQVGLIGMLHEYAVQVCHRTGW